MHLGDRVGMTNWKDSDGGGYHAVIQSGQGQSRFQRIVTWAIVSSVVIKSQGLTYIAHRFLRQLPRLLTAIRKNIGDQFRRFFIHAGSLAHRLLLFEYRL